MEHAFCERAGEWGKMGVEWDKKFSFLKGVFSKFILIVLKSFKLFQKFILDTIFPRKITRIWRKKLYL